MNEQIRLDFQRPERLDFDEAILCARKSDPQLTVIMDRVLAHGARCLMTRLEPDVFARMAPTYRERLDYDPVSRTAYLNWTPAGELELPRIAVVSAGSSDMPQAAEVTRTLTYLGAATKQFIDVGVAGLWRLLESVDELRTFPVIVAVAGMDGALPSVLGGLVPGVIICLPTSTGYGVSNGGETALHAALASCAPGLAVVNIDNGYGAACAAFRALNMIRRAAAAATV
ncbi:nickel pincer cofactor biosynthesis protein LarB [Mesorhizobium sp. M1A.F.Ca.ET.072.01.1.1]|uniref:nickel pincer cofactor biosynthesis protein LarB n=1 Tax=Mesorhizobium sp. M1A.F.Ca.ET.072.01.1.1 TaxID=2496753 RepID=UPI000FD22BDE|nr:nickel pincer cofactor biosynthesis protein LarB [Mesorhizobium sp. M1A.F.Ca.ET.072.01.1.1]RUW54131.1 nickel pincer cofactor biosynthesis protein LarB [Mesorhizobium sp. M1A.F.Ca.ET.072.01.1.1]TIV05098.1 MAG: nickel pincer cofactor biosynthesis protein LarB [Mesorhizobium sp.]